MQTKHHELARVVDLFTTLLGERLTQEKTTPVLPSVPSEQLLKELKLELPSDGLAFEEIASRLRAVIEATPSTATGQFFNQLYGGREPFAILGEMVSSVLNNSMYTYKVGGPNILVENELVEHMGGMLGFKNHEGTFTPGGSLSNLCALLVARDRACPHVRERGADGSRLRIYTSVESHYCVPKAASILGIGRDNVVLIPADERGRMLPGKLAAAIDADLESGYVPVAVNATVGTTVQGAIDPIDPIADICEARGVWLHLDGAFGATMIFDERFASQLKGTERADSITWDAHKLMGVPLTCSLLLIRERGRLKESFEEAAGYLFQSNDDHLNPGTRSIQCGRRNDALKLWTNWLHFGTAGYVKRTEHMRNLALLSADCVREAEGLHLTKEPETLTVCFTVDGMTPEYLCDAIQDAGRAMVGHAVVDGEKVVRMALVDAGTTEADVRGFFGDVESLLAATRQRVTVG